MRNFCSIDTAAFVSTSVANPENPLDISNVLPQVKAKLADALEIRLSEMNTYWSTLWDENSRSGFTPSEETVIQRLADFYLSCFKAEVSGRSECRSFLYSNLNTGVSVTWTFVVIHS